ncbi:hypothetical protein PORY_002581 [Pneumocystis oryctolagi]|uniref:Uncharacterized protein n=1 Tax=Pneumocystis oryctolagi TaxID=42067 RepID=A0ACB7CAX4_9ASCO|nr:hypothetical protein PORY_002581 [Pneumocystis oryctolagi]
MVSSTYLGINLGFYSSESSDTFEDLEPINCHKDNRDKADCFTIDNFIKKITSKKRKTRKKCINAREKTKTVSKLGRRHTPSGNKERPVLNDQKKNEKKKGSRKSESQQPKDSLKLFFSSSDEFDNSPPEILLDPIVTSPSTKSNINKKIYLPMSAHKKRIIMPKEYSLTHILKTKKRKKKYISLDNNCIFEGFEDIGDEDNAVSTHGRLSFKSSDDITYEKESSDYDKIEQAIDEFQPKCINRKSRITNSLCFISKEPSLYKYEKNCNIYQNDVFISEPHANNIIDSQDVSLHNVDFKDFLKVTKNLSLCIYSSSNNNMFCKSTPITQKFDITGDTMTKNKDKRIYFDDSDKQYLFNNCISTRKNETILFPVNIKKIKKSDTIEEYYDTNDFINSYNNYKKESLSNILEKNGKDLFKYSNKKQLDFAELDNDDKIYIDKADCYNDNTSILEKRYLSEISSNIVSSKLSISNQTANEHELNIVHNKCSETNKQNDINAENISFKPIDSLSILNSPLQSNLSLNYSHEDYKRKSEDLQIVFSLEKELLKFNKKNEKNMKNNSSINKLSIYSNKKCFKRSNTTIDFFSASQNNLFNFIRRKTINISPNESFINNNSLSTSKFTFSKIELNKQSSKNIITDDFYDFNTLLNTHKLLINDYKVSNNSFSEIREAWYSDLECDYINPIDLCNKLNMYILPEAVIHGFVTLLFLLARNWLPFALNFPMLVFNINKIITNQHTLDATEIFRTLNQHKKESFIKLAIYLFFFFFYLYLMISILVQNNS